MPWLTPEDNAPVGTICRTINIPNDIGYLSAVTGALLELTKAHNWEQHGAATPDEVAALLLPMFLDFTASECEVAVPQVYPANFFMTGDAAYDVSGGSLLLTVSTANPHALLANVTPAAQGNRLHYRVFCRAGTYNIRLRGQRAANMARTKILVDDVYTGTEIEWYNATTVNNSLVTGSFAIDTDGEHKLTFHADTKHASSTGYNMQIASILGWTALS